MAPRTCSDLAESSPCRSLDGRVDSTGELRLFEQTRVGFEKRPAEALALATDPLGPLPEGMAAVDLAAYTVVANVLLNLDETFVKR